MGGVGGQGRGPGGRGGALGHPWLRVGSTFLPSAGFVRQDWLGGDQGGLDRTDPARFGAGAPGGGLGADGPGLLQRHQAASDFLSQSSDQQDLGPREPLIPAPSRAHMAAETELGLA